MTKAIISLSGGMDSTTVLALAKSQGVDCQCVGFNYGGKHNKLENEAARQVAAFYKVPLQFIDLSNIMSGFKSALTSKDQPVPEGHYEAENMRQTVVPGRNIIFSAILAGIAWDAGAEEIWIGIHAGDHHIYCDCRPKFYSAMKQAISYGTDHLDNGQGVRLVAPFLHENKATILQKGFALSPPVPYHLTRTCYTDNPTACGRCGSCQERLASFAQIGKEDPISYQDKRLLPATT